MGKDKGEREWNNQGTKAWGIREADGRWGREYYSTRSRETEDTKATENGRSGRRSRNGRGNLIEADRERTEGIKRHEERKERERKQHEQQKYGPPRTRY